MAETKRFNRILLGCGVGCGSALVLLVGGCFAFNAWLHSPAEVLQPAALLDPTATTYVACRLDLAEPPTRAFIDAMLAAAQPPVEHAEASPLLMRLARWNEQRQRRDVERLFPITAAWLAWPGDDEAPASSAVVVSARGFGHHLLLADWVLGLIAGRTDRLPMHDVSGERVYEVELEPGESVYAFLDPRGAIVCLDFEAVAPAVERLRRGRAGAAAAEGLERRLAALPADLPLRGVVLDRGGEVARMLRWLAPDADPLPAWAAFRAATVAGRFTGGAGLALTLDLAVDPAAVQRREELAGELRDVLGAAWEGATVREEGDGVRVELVIDDVARHLDELEEEGRRRRRRAEPAD